MDTSGANNQQKIQEWMENIAQGKKPATKLIFDKDKKQLIPVPLYDSRADRNLTFGAEEAKRYCIQ